MATQVKPVVVGAPKAAQKPGDACYRESSVPTPSMEPSKPGVKIRGTGAATKGVTARGPMA